MRYIKAKFRLTNPGSYEYNVFGWETVWNKKTVVVGDEAVSAGDIVSFQPIRVQPSGKFLFPATPKNVRLAKAMLAKGQITLAPGEKLELVVEPVEAKEDKWPEPPSAKSPESDEDGYGEAPEANGVDSDEVAADEPQVVAAPKRRGRPRKIDPADAVPDTQE